MPCIFRYIEDEQKGWIAHDTCIACGAVRPHVLGTPEIPTRPGKEG